MQKVRATFSSCLAVLIIGVLAGYAVMLLPQYAEGETISSSPTITIGSPAQQPVRIDANSSSEAITIRVNGVPYTYYTTVSKSTPSPALKPLVTAPKVPTGLRVVSIGDGQLDVAWNKNSESDLKHYRLAYKPAGGSYKSVFTTGTSYSLTGLENGKKYTLKVKAISNSGAETSYCSFVYATPVNSSPSPSESKVEVKTLAPGTKYATPLYVINSGKPGPVVMVVGGVHGNEKAGYTAARKITEYQISRGTLLVLPEANQLAIKAGRRAASGYSDLNRSFPQTSSQAPKTALSRAIFNAIKEHKVDWLIDLHEGYDYYKNSNTSSVGQTLIYYPANSTRTTAQAIVNDLNKGIKTSNQKFTLLRYPVKGSLARAAGEYLGVRAMIFETCSKPALSTRVNYQTQAVNKLLNTLNMR